MFQVLNDRDDERIEELQNLLNEIEV